MQINTRNTVKRIIVSEICQVDQIRKIVYQRADAMADDLIPAARVSMSCRKSYLVAEAADFLPSFHERTQLPLAELLAGQIWRLRAGPGHRRRQTPLKSILLFFFPSFA